jgi:hypothetical protein
MSNPSVSPPSVSPPSLMSVREFCRSHGLSKTSFYRRAAEMPAVVKLGRRTLISSAAAQRWREALGELPCTALGKLARGGSAA